VNHAFQQSIDNVVEDVTDIVLDLKKILIVSAQARADEPPDQGQQGRRGHGGRRPGRRQHHHQQYVMVLESTSFSYVLLQIITK
jgi:hypothetical protein